MQFWLRNIDICIMDTFTGPTIGECRFYARECTRWSEASGSELTRKILLEVADIWAQRALPEQAANHPRATEPKSQLSVGLRCPSGRLYMQGKRPDLKILLSLPKPRILARPSDNSAKNTRERGSPSLTRRPRISLRRPLHGASQFQR
jgi:hypothetical protein